MHVGIFAKTFSRPDLSATLDAVVASGLDTMQFNMALAPSTPAADIREETASHGLTMAAVSGTYNLAHPDAAVRADGRRWLADLIATAPTLGTSVVTLCTGSRDPDDMWRRHPDYNGTPEAWRDMLESVAAALAVADAHNVTLGFEPEHNNVVDSAAAGRRLLEELRSTQLKVVIDPANLEPSPDALREAFELLGDDLVLAHAKDVRRDGTIVAAGHGDLDYELYLALLDDAGGDVPLILHGLAESEVPGCVAFLRAALAKAPAP
jgi:sugar phosphate isomerase/epimerase